MQEEWRPITNFPGYEVSNTGKVRSWLTYQPPKRRKEPRELRPCAIDAVGRLQVGLCKGGRHYRLTVHRLVLTAFIGPCPLGMEGCHNDDDHANNRLENLRWDTHQNNTADSIRNGRSRGERNSKARLTDGQVIRIRELFVEGYSLRDLAGYFKVSYATIGRIVTGEGWSHIGGPISRKGSARPRRSAALKAELLQKLADSH